MSTGQYSAIWETDSGCSWWRLPWRSFPRQQHNPLRRNQVLLDLQKWGKEWMINIRYNRMHGTNFNQHSWIAMKCTQTAMDCNIWNVFLMWTLAVVPVVYVSASHCMHEQVMCICMGSYIREQRYHAAMVSPLVSIVPCIAVKPHKSPRARVDQSSHNYRTREAHTIIIVMSPLHERIVCMCSL